MRSRERVAILLLVAASACGCAMAPTAPNDWLPDPSDVPASPYGGWIQIDYRSPRGELEIDGELLAIQNNHVYVLRGDAVRPVSIDSIEQARLIYYDANASGVAGITVLGTVSTISNGFYLVLTAPMWMIFGGTTAGLRSRDPIVDVPHATWSELIPYARFPQGLPPDFMPRSAPAVVEPAAQSPPPQVVESEVAAPAPPAPATTEWGYCLGVGSMRYADRSDIGGVIGLNVSKSIVTGGIRFSIGNREGVYTPSASQYSEALDGGYVFDLGVLVGLRGAYRGVRAALRAGPAAWGFGVADLTDIRWSFAAQGELFFYPRSNVGFGSIVAYNDNEFEDFYIVTIGIAVGPR